MAKVDMLGTGEDLPCRIRFKTRFTSKDLPTVL